MNDNDYPDHFMGYDYHLHYFSNFAPFKTNGCLRIKMPKRIISPYEVELDAVVIRQRILSPDQSTSSIPISSVTTTASGQSQTLTTSSIIQTPDGAINLTTPISPLTPEIVLSVTTLRDMLSPTNQATTVSPGSVMTEEIVFSPIISSIQQTPDGHNNMTTPVIVVDNVFPPLPQSTGTDYNNNTPVVVTPTTDQSVMSEEIIFSPIISSLTQTTDGHVNMTTPVVDMNIATPSSTGDMSVTIFSPGDSSTSPPEQTPNQPISSVKWWTFNPDRPGPLNKIDIINGVGALPDLNHKTVRFNDQVEIIEPTTNADMTTVTEVIVIDTPMVSPAQTSTQTPQTSTQTPQTSTQTPQTSTQTPQTSTQTPQTSTQTPQTSTQTPQTSTQTQQQPQTSGYTCDDEEDDTEDDTSEEDICCPPKRRRCCCCVRPQCCQYCIRWRCC
jgi:hypothetical protein